MFGGGGTTGKAWKAGEASTRRGGAATGRGRGTGGAGPPRASRGGARDGEGHARDGEEWESAAHGQTRNLAGLLEAGCYSRHAMALDAAEGVAVSVVLPCLNEEAAVGAVVDQPWAGIAAAGLPAGGIV